MADDESRRAFRQAVRYVSMRSRTTHEVYKKLTAEHSSEIAQETVARLIDLNYLNDEAFTERYIEYARGKGEGPFKVIKKLGEKGISAELIQNYRERISSDELLTAMKAAESRLKSLRGLTKESQFKRLAGFLNRRGYSTSIIYKVCDSLLNADDSFTGEL